MKSEVMRSDVVSDYYSGCLQFLRAGDPPAACCCSAVMLELQRAPPAPEIIPPLIC